MDTGTVASFGQSQKSRMGNVLASVKILNVPIGDENVMCLDQFLECMEGRFRQVPVKGLCEFRFPCEIEFGWFHFGVL